MLLSLAVTAADRQVACPAPAMVGAMFVLAAEAGEVLIHGDTSVTSRRLKGRASGHKLLVYQKLTDFNDHKTPPELPARRLESERPRDQRRGLVAPHADVFGEQAEKGLARLRGGQACPSKTATRTNPARGNGSD
jgi:hypothetical protein